MSDPIYIYGYHQDIVFRPQSTQLFCGELVRKIGNLSSRVKTHLAGPVKTKILAICALVIFSTSFEGSRMKPFYPKSAVQPVTVHKLSNDEISIRYRVYPESSHYSDGVDYIKMGNELKVVINRCSIRDKCHPMAKTTIPLDNNWSAEVHIPYHGENVILAHSDGEQHIYP